MSQTGSSQSQTVYIQLNQITELRRRDVFLKDVGEVTCRDKVILSKCRALKVKSIPEKEARRYVMSALEVVRMLEALDPSIETTWESRILSSPISRQRLRKFAGSG